MRPSNAFELHQCDQWMSFPSDVIYVDIELIFYEVVYLPPAFKNYSHQNREEHKIVHLKKKSCIEFYYCSQNK